MRTYPMIPGVPAAGHVTGGGHWHPGRAEGCAKCEPYDPHRDAVAEARAHDTDMREEYEARRRRRSR